MGLPTENFCDSLNNFQVKNHLVYTYDYMSIYIFGYTYKHKSIYT